MRLPVTLLLLLLGVTSLRADDWRFNSTAAVYVAAVGWDVQTTDRALDRGAVERNPLLGPDPSDRRLVASAALGAGLMVYTTRKLYLRGYRKTAITALIVASLAHGYFAVHNQPD